MEASLQLQTRQSGYRGQSEHSTHAGKLLKQQTTGNLEAPEHKLCLLLFGVGLVG
jgi:hypothetical protein